MLAYVLRQCWYWNRLQNAHRQTQLSYLPTNVVLYCFSWIMLPFWVLSYEHFDYLGETVQWTDGYFCLLDAGLYSYCTKGTCDFMKREGRKVKQGLTTHWQFSPRNSDLPPPGGWFVVNWSTFKPGLYVSVQRLGCVFKVRWSSSIQAALVFTSICCCSWQWYCGSPEATSVFASDQPFCAWYLLFHFLPLFPHISSGDVFICLRSSLDTELHHY